MSAIHILLVGTLVLNCFLLFLLISVVKDLVTVKMLTQQTQQQLHSALIGIINKQNAHDMMLSKIGNGFNELTSLLGNIVDKLSFFESFSPKNGSIYRTMDGKFAGASLEDLIKKIQDAGEEQTYLSQEEIDGLRKLFEDDDDDEEENELR